MVSHDFKTREGKTPGMQFVLKHLMKTYSIMIKDKQSATQIAKYISLCDAKLAKTSGFPGVRVHFHKQSRNKIKNCHCLTEVLDEENN